MSAENFTATKVRCSETYFALTFDKPNCVSKVSNGPFVLLFGVAVSSLWLVSNAVDKICAMRAQRKDEISAQKCLISKTFSNSSNIGEGDIMQNQFDIGLSNQ